MLLNHKTKVTFSVCVPDMKFHVSGTLDMEGGWCMTELHFLHFKEIQLCHALPSTFDVHDT